MLDRFKYAPYDYAAVGQFLDKYNAKWTRREDGTILVEGDLDIRGYKGFILPELGRVVVEGNFICQGAGLHTLVHSPLEVGGDYFASYNNIQRLTGLYGTKIKGQLIFADNPCLSYHETFGSNQHLLNDLYFLQQHGVINKPALSDHKALPSRIVDAEVKATPSYDYEATVTFLHDNGVECDGVQDHEGLLHAIGNLNLRNRGYKTLPDLSRVKLHGDFDISYNPDLKNNVGAPNYVGGSYIASYCDNMVSLEGMSFTVAKDVHVIFNPKLASLVGGSRTVGGHYYCSDNALKNYDGIAINIGGKLFGKSNPIEDISALDSVTIMGDKIIEQPKPVAVLPESTNRPLRYGYGVHVARISNGAADGRPGFFKTLADENANNRTTVGAVPGK